MKKVGLLVVFSIFSMLFNILCVSAADEYEVIPKENSEFVTNDIRWTGKEFVITKRNSETGHLEKWISNTGFDFSKVDLSDNIANKNLLLWNGKIYVAVGRMMRLSQHYINKQGTYTQSPLYVLDKDFNVIKTVEYKGNICTISAKNGEFHFITQERVDSMHSKFTYYRTENFESFVIIEGDYDDLVNLAPSDSNIFGMNDVIYEGENRAGAFEAGFFINNIGCSLDGIYYFELPSMPILFDSLYEHAWYTNGNLYIELENEYLKIPIEKRSETYVKVDENILAFEQPPVVEDGRTLVPMRFLFECLGDKVTWDEETRSVTAENKNSAVTFSLDSLTADVNGTEQTMDVPAKLIGDKTYVPLRFLSENLGYTVTWDEATNTAIVETK